MITMCKDMKKFGVWCLKFEVFLAVHKKNRQDFIPTGLFSVRFQLRLLCHFGLNRDDIHV